MPVTLDRRARRQLDAITGKPLVVPRTNQLPIQTRRGDLEKVRPAGNCIFHIQDRSYLAADVGAILVGNASWLIYKDSEHAGFAASPKLHVYQFQATRGGHTLHHAPYPFNVQAHESSGLRSFLTNRQQPKTKSGLAPTGVLRQKR